MRRRRLLLGAGLLALLGLAGLAGLLIPRPGAGAGITRENYERIQDGMTVADVEAIFGRPADLQYGAWSGGGFCADRGCIWEDDDAGIRVHFASSGQVDEKTWTGPSLLDRLRGLLPW